MTARDVEPPTEYVSTPCDWALCREPDSERWLKLYRDEVAYLGPAAVSLSALRYLTHKQDAYFGRHDRWEQWAGVSKSTLTRHVQILVEKGYIVRDGRQGLRVHRYLLSRAEPKTDDNDAFAVMPIGFLGRVQNFNERVVFSIVISSFRRAEGIIEQMYPGMVAGEEEFLFANFIRWHEFHLSPGRSGLFGLVAKDVIKWGLSLRGYRDAKKQLRENGLIEVYGADETFVVPFGRTDQFDEIAASL